MSSFLKKSNVKIKSQKFSSIINQVSTGDFVYFDPPYDYEIGKKGFEAYQKEGFGTTGQVSLANLCVALNKKGVKFMVSNHNTKLVNELYSQFLIETISAKRLVGGKGASREDVEEVIITNINFFKEGD